MKQPTLNKYKTEDYSELQECCECGNAFDQFFISMNSGGFRACSEACTGIMITQWEKGTAPSWCGGDEHSLIRAELMQETSK